MSHDRFYRPILLAINSAVELGSNFAEKIGRYYRSSVIGLKLTAALGSKTHWVIVIDITNVALEWFWSVAFDWEALLLWLQADYVLVLVSPLYRRVVSGKLRREDNSDNVLHARHIHDRMYAEHRASLGNGPSTTRRFVPVVMSGAATSDVPEWLRKSSRPFSWPQQYQHLMFYLIKPAQVIADYVSKKDHHALPHGRKGPP